MGEATKNLPSEIFDWDFPSTEDRLQQAYNDPIAQDLFGAIMRARDNERPGLQVQLTTYLAATYALFPEESQVIHDSLKGIN